MTQFFVLTLVNLFVFTLNADRDGSWPRFGNTRENQQISRSKLDATTIKNSKISECRYTSIGSIAYYGFPIVDNDGVGYIADTSGDLFAFDLDTCDEIWRISISETLGFDKGVQVISRQSPTLYEDIVLIGAPNARHYEHPLLYPLNAPCFAIGYDKYTGALKYKIDLTFVDLNNDGENDLTEAQSLACHAHGFIVDKENKYAYGGMAAVSNFLDTNNTAANIGRMYKINLETLEIENVFYHFPNNNGETDDSYRGVSHWGFPALIEDYLVYGTGNLYSRPDEISECLLDSDSNPSLIPFNNYPYNICGDDRSDVNFWRCLEDNVFVDSIIVLNVNDFSIVSITRTMGVDTFDFECHFLPPGVGNCPVAPGPDLDVVSIAVYKNKQNELVGVTTTKAGQFIALNILTGRVFVSKQTGIGGAGNSVWGQAIDPETEIAISANTGFHYVTGPYVLPNGDIICNTGTAEAIDLKTGKTKWIFVVPYGRIVSQNANACDDYPSPDQWVDFAQHGRCTLDPFGNRHIDDSDAKIIYLPDEISNPLPISSIERAHILGGIAISNKLVYIPLITGDVYVLKLENGEFVTRLECPQVKRDDGQYNRAGIHGGVTVVDDRVVFYCGAYIIFSDRAENGNMVQSIKFNLQSVSDSVYISDNNDQSDSYSLSDSSSSISNKSFLPFFSSVFYVYVLFIFYFYPTLCCC